MTDPTPTIAQRFMEWWNTVPMALRHAETGRRVAWDAWQASNQVTAWRGLKLIEQHRLTWMGMEGQFAVEAALETLEKQWRAHFGLKETPHA